MLAAVDKSGVQQKSRKNLEEDLQCAARKHQNCFKRWRNIWPTLNLWLYSESTSTSSVNSSSILQGKTIIFIMQLYQAKTWLLIYHLQVW